MLGRREFLRTTATGIAVALASAFLSLAFPSAATPSPATPAAVARGAASGAPAYPGPSSFDPVLNVPARSKPAEPVPGKVIEPATTKAAEPAPEKPAEPSSEKPGEPPPERPVEPPPEKPAEPSPSPGPSSSRPAPGSSSAETPFPAAPPPPSPPPASAPAPPPPATSIASPKKKGHFETSAIGGRILLPDGQAGAQEAILHAIHLEDGRLAQAAPATGDGRYEIRGLQFGYYEFAIDAGGALYAVTRPAQLDPGKYLKLDFRLHAPPEPTADGAALQGSEPIPALNRQATAAAEIVGSDRDPKSGHKVRNLAIVGGAIVLLALVL
jgi:hypothetical protein